jgi:hypothetical protein
LNGSTRNGERLAIGWPNSFCVIDLPSRTVLFEAKGRFPCISPSGEEVAFVCSNRKLVSAGNSCHGCSDKWNPGKNCALIKRLLLSPAGTTGR